MWYLIIGGVAMLAGVVMSRFRQDKAIQMLSQEQKALLISPQGKRSLKSVLFLTAIILAFLLLSFYTTLAPRVLLVGYVIAFCAYIVFQTYDTYSRLKRLGLPQEFLKSLMVAIVLRLAGILIMMAMVSVWVLQEGPNGMNFGGNLPVT